MSFDAGEIIAYLKLDREKFNLELDEVKAQTEKGIEVEVKPTLDKRAVDEVLVEEEPLRKDIEPEVKPTYAKAEAEQVGKALASDVVSAFSGGLGGTHQPGGGGADGGPMGNLIASMLAQGLNKKDIASGLKNLGFSSNEIKDALYGGLIKDISSGTGGKSSAGPSIAESLVRDFFPTAKEMDAAIARYFEIQKEQGGPGKPDLLGQFATQFLDSYTGGRGWGQGHEHGTGGLSLADYIAKNVVPTAGELDSAIGNRIHSLGKDSNGVGVTVKNDLAGMIQHWFAGGFGGGKGNFWQKLINGPDGPFSALSGGTGAMKAIFNPIGASAGTAFLGAFGAALGGGVAGTAIGGAGVFAALIPGYIALMQGLKAYTALSTPGASTKGMSKGALGIGEAIKNLLGKGSKGLSGLMIPIYPDITKFIKALTTDIPLIKKFAQPAIAAMGHFFDHIDKGMKSKNFSKFVTDMSTLVGPIMGQFSGTILNMGGAIGGFLKLFGPEGKNTIGPWFVKVSGQFDKFMNHIKFGPGFANGVKTVFGAIGEWVKLGAKVIEGVAQAMAPFGIAFFAMAGDIAKGLNKIPHAVPVITGLATALLSLSIAMKGISLAKGAFGSAVGWIQKLMNGGSGGGGLTGGASKGTVVDLLATIARNTGIIAGEDAAGGKGVPVVTGGGGGNSLWGSFKKFITGGGGASDGAPGATGFSLSPGFYGLSAAQIAAADKMLKDKYPGLGGSGTPGESSIKHRGNVTINVDARQSTDPSGVHKAAHSAISATLPQLRAALARGAA